MFPKGLDIGRQVKNFKKATKTFKSVIHVSSSVN